jgi:predicted ATPase/transcriptional regulator with XRE-family HTH domain
MAEVDQRHSFGALLREYRAVASLTQAELAEKAGLSARAITDLERGVRRFPYKHTVERLAAALELSSAEVAIFRDAATSSPRRPMPEGGDAGSLGVAAAAVGGNGYSLPLQLTSLVGREQELAEVQRLLGTTRLLTLAGVGGIGKTRLALAAIDALSTEQPDSVAFIELASLADSALLSGTVAAKLGVREQRGRSVHDTLLEVLRSRTLLLLLDNCEHLIEACAILANDLLRACPGVRILATSREPLRISGELTWRVPPLPAPDPCQPYGPDELVDYPAVRLFVERARAVQPTFVLTPDTGTAVAGICARLDGLPLAIELAAAQMRILAPDQIVTKLDDALQLLVGGSRAAPARQQTLRATFDWSYALLSAAEQTVLRRLAVFAGGWSLEAAEAVCVTDAFETSELLSALSHLVEASLVVSGEQDGRSRYRLLESVRQYAREILGDSGELRAVQRAHASFFLTFAEKLHLDRREGGPHRLTAGRTLGGERDNLRAALRWCIDSHEVEFAQRLVAVYSGFWIGPTEERGRLNEVLAMDGGDATSNARATALARSAIVARNQGDLERAVEEYLAAANRPQERQYLPHPQLSQWAGRDRGLARTVRASRSAPRGEPGSCPVRRVATDRGDRARLPRLAGMRARDLRYRETVRSRRSRARARYSPMHGRSR